MDLAPVWISTRPWRPHAPPTSPCSRPCAVTGSPSSRTSCMQSRDDGVVIVSTTTDRAKFHNLRREPWAALKVDGDELLVVRRDRGRM